MEYLILLLSIALVAISNLITTITVNKRINRLETLLLTEHQITYILADDFIKNKEKENKKNGKNNEV